MRRIKVKLSPALEQDDITQRLEEALAKEKAKDTEVEAQLQTPLNNKQGFDQETADQIETEITTDESVATQTEESVDETPSEELETILESVETPATDETTTTDDEEVVETEVTEVTEVTETTETAETESVASEEDDETEETAAEVTTTEVANTETPLEDTTTSDDPLATEVSDEVDAGTPAEEVPAAGGTVTDVVADAVMETATGETSTVVSNFTQTLKTSYDTAVANGFEGSFEDFLASITETISKKEQEVQTNALGTTEGAGGETTPDEGRAAEIDAAAEEGEEQAAQSDSAQVTEDVLETDTETSSAEETDVVDEDTATEVTESTSEVTEEVTETETDTTETSDEEAPATEVTENTEETESTSEEVGETGDDETGSGETNLNGEEVPGDEESEEGAEEESEHTPEEPAGDDDESLNEFIDKIDEKEESIEDTEEMVSEAVDASSRLGRIAEIVKDALEEAKEGDEDDVSESLAKIAQVATECLTDRLGIEAPEGLDISVESFSDASGVLFHYEVSLEGIKETLSKVADAILKAVEAIAKWIGDQYRNILLAAGITEKRIAKLREKVKKAREGELGEVTKFTNAGLASSLRIGGSVGKDTAKQLVKTAKIGQVVYKNLSDWVLDNVTATMAKNRESFKRGMAVFFPFGNQSYDGQGLSAVSDPVKEGFITKEESEFINVEKTDELPGSKALVLFVPKHQEFDSSSAKNYTVYRNQDSVGKVLTSGKFGVKLMDYIPNDDSVVSDELDVLTPDQMEEILDAAERLMKVVQEYKQVRPKIDKVRREVKGLATLLKMTNQIDRFPDDFERSSSIRKMGMYATVARVIEEPALSFTKYSLNLVSASMKYVNLSLKQYGFEEESTTDTKSGAGAQVPAMA